MRSLPPAIAFRLRGVESNRDAIGAVITLETELGRQTRSLQAGSGFLSQHSKEIFFGLGAAKGPVQASILWPSGTRQELRDLPVNHRVWVEEGSQPSNVEPFRTPAALRQSSSVISDETQTGVSPPHNPGEALPAAAETWLLAPIEAPDFSLPNLTEQLRTLSSLRGDPILLNFWSAEAGGCKEDCLTFNKHHAAWATKGLQFLSVNLDSALDDATRAENLRALVRDQRLSFPILRGSDDVAAVYNIIYRYLFDRHRDLTLPTSFLIDAAGEIVKVYQGPVNADHVAYDLQHIPATAAQRLARALPFPGVTDTVEFGRNYLSYGSVFFQRGYMEQAAASFQIALRVDPQSAEALYGIGSVYLNQQKTAEARESFERALKLRASYPDTLANSWNNLGLLAAREGHTDEAIRDFQEALKLSPDHIIALINLGSAYRQQKGWDDARKTYERALEVNANDAEANYGLGMVFAQSDDTARAFDSLQRALQLRPVYPEALNNLGILYLRTHRRDEAVASFERCIRVAPTFDQAYLNLARVYSIEGRPDKARPVLEDLLKQRPDDEPALKMLEQLGHQ